MRLWHVDMIPFLPDKQLLSQWRECCSIASNLASRGTPNHILVNQVVEYSSNQFKLYCYIVATEFESRGWTISKSVWNRLMNNIYKATDEERFNENNNPSKIFEDWHNDRYFNQCFYNLQEKYDCGGISKAEWEVFVDGCFRVQKKDLMRMMEEMR